MTDLTLSIDESDSHDGSSADREVMFSWLREFNEAQNGECMRQLARGAERAFFLSAFRQDRLVGGLDGVTVGKWVKINLMAVADDDRGQGIGTRLVREALRFGLDRGCEFGYVDTMTYQAPRFYSRLGFVEVGRLADWDSFGHDKVFFSIKLK